MERAISFQIVESPSAAMRLDAAADFLRQFPRHQPITIVAATRGAADDLARRIARERVATFGLARFSLTQLAARIAATRLAGRGIAPSTSLGAEAVSARASFEAANAGALAYFGSVARAPGFPRALANTVADLRLAGITANDVGRAAAVGPDLAHLLSRVEQEFESSNTADRGRLLEAAAESAGDEPFLRAPLLLLDVPVETRAEGRFVHALISVATSVCATVPAHDTLAARALVGAGGELQSLHESSRNDLALLRAHLFADRAPEPRSLDGSLEFFSAPGEGRECVEIARRVLNEARRGVPFDEMAILVRAPHQYHGLLEHALSRAGIPAFFDRGTRRPHPAGRAFLALIAAAVEGLSARRVAEYLSLGQLPAPEQPPSTWARSTDDVLAGSGSEEQDETSEQSLDASEEDAEGAAIAGTLRAPRKWERLLVEAAVIGGNPERWRRRLDGLAHEFTARLQEVRRLDPEAPRGYALLRELAHLTHLRSFVLPIVDEMAGWPSSALWGDWLDRLEAFAPRVLRTTPYVLRVLADLRPMSDVGPVTLEEVRAVLAERLRTVDSEPPARRYGRVFVGTPSQARGRSFRIVFVPGIAERIFPQKPAQDPLLRDEARLALESGLATRADHSRRERVLLRLAAGAAVDRLCVSYPRLDVAEGRARVPSFYALDLLRGATGRIPDHDALERAAAQAGDASLAWPAPADAALAIDDQEHDLAVLGELLEARDVSTVRGHAQYMLRLNPALRRSVTERWARGQKKWSPFDGLTRVTDGTRDALAAQRLGTRPYSLSALQKFSICPYQFLLSAVIRLQPFDDPVPLQRLDPLTKGTIVHEMQARVFRDLQERTLLPVTLSTLDIALRVLEEVVVAVAGKYYELLAPAIDRVWREEIASIARDMRGWLRRIADEGEEWTPKHFELSFGLRRDGEHDPASVQDPVILENGFQLRGSVDLIEEHRPTGVLRVTDHKTGKDRHKDTLVIGGGAVLQPVLYSLVVEQITGKPVAESRLFFCTSAGGYKVRPVMMTPLSRRAGIEALEVVDRAIELGALPTAPAEQACAWCDFRSVCGPHEELRVARKPVDRFRDLLELRSRP